VRGEDGDPGYLLLGDVFRQDGQTRRYTSYLHTEAGNTIALLPTEAGATRARFGAPNGAALDIAMVGGSPLQLARGSFTADYPEIGKHLRLDVTTDADALQLLTVLVPTGSDTRSVTSVPATGGLALAVAEAGRRDLVVLRTTPVGDTATRLLPGTVRTTEVTTDGELAVVTVDSSTGAALRFVLAEGSTLAHRGRRLAQIDGGPATVATSSTRVVVEGDAVSAFRIEAAPSVQTVTLNGTVVRTSRCGTTVVYPARAVCG
jgi:hypothetical protein